MHTKGVSIQNMPRSIIVPHSKLDSFSQKRYDNQLSTGKLPDHGKTNPLGHREELEYVKVRILSSKLYYQSSF